MNATAIKIQPVIGDMPEKANAKIFKFPKNKDKGGCPSKYTNELAEEICAAIMDSDKGIARLCKENKHWPSKKTIFNWLKKNKEFKKQYEIAKQIQIHNLMDELLEISEKSIVSADHYKTHPIGEDLIKLMRVKIDKIKWKTVHLMPRKYILISS